MQHLILLTAPLFLLVMLGYSLGRWGGWKKEVSDTLTRFVFTVAIPALVFRMMSGVSKLPPPDWRLLIAFFGSCLLVFLIGRVLGRLLFRMDGVSQSIFGLGGVFSNVVMLGVPLSRLTLGDGALPAVSLLVVFNAFLLWTLVTISVEWARNSAPTWSAVAKTAKDVILNPLVGSIMGGTAFGFTGIELPGVVDQTLGLVAQAAAPLALIALGMGLAFYALREGWRESAVLCVVKLVVQPFVVYLLARLLDLPPLQTQVVVVIAALPTGANVYMMARHFQTLEGPIASSLVLSTAVSSLTIPFTLALLGAGS